VGGSRLGRGNLEEKSGVESLEGNEPNKRSGSGLAGFIDLELSKQKPVFKSSCEGKAMKKGGGRDQRKGGIQFLEKKGARKKKRNLSLDVRLSSAAQRQKKERKPRVSGRCENEFQQYG